jgi:nucleotide-binding universal stress UspA family protein
MGVDRLFANAGWRTIVLPASAPRSPAMKIVLAAGGSTFTRKALAFLMPRPLGPELLFVGSVAQEVLSISTLPVLLVK